MSSDRKRESISDFHRWIIHSFESSFFLYYPAILYLYSYSHKVSPRRSVSTSSTTHFIVIISFQRTRKSSIWCSAAAEATLIKKLCLLSRASELKCNNNLDMFIGVRVHRTAFPHSEKYVFARNLRRWSIVICIVFLLFTYLLFNVCDDRETVSRLLLSKVPIGIVYVVLHDIFHRQCLRNAGKNLVLEYPRWKQNSTMLKLMSNNVFIPVKPYIDLWSTSNFEKKSTIDWRRFYIKIVPAYRP